MAPTIDRISTGILTDNPADHSCKILLEKSDFKPRWLIELGSGLDGINRLMRDAGSLAFSNLPGFPIPTTPGHSGVVRFYSGRWDSAYLFFGRSHLYEGLTPLDTAMIIHLAALLCIEGVILCSVCGAIDENLKSGDLMLCEGALHIPFSRGRLSPLSHPAVSPSLELVQRSHFDWRLSSTIRKLLENANIGLKTGVIGIVTGPNYETRAEVEMLRRLGASAVTMSCAPSLQLAFQLKIPVVMLCGVTNRAGVVGSPPLQHQQVLEEADAKIVPRLAGLFSNLIGLP